MTQPNCEFHVSRPARDRYTFDQSVFETDGNVVFANFEAAREFAERINAQRPIEQRVKVGQLNAMGLIDEILHLVVAQYRAQVKPSAMAEALAAVRAAVGAVGVEQTLRAFAEQFPPVAVYRNELAPSDYLANPINQQNTLEELLLLWLANHNPAFAKHFGELFDDLALRRDTAYLAVIKAMQNFFAAQPTFAGESKNLIELLREPAEQNPDSLEAQLEFIAQRFERVSGLSVLVRRMGTRMLIGRDVLREEQRQLTFGTGFVDFTPAKGSVPVPEYKGPTASLHLPEYEAFTPDREWMPRCVLIAKTTYVWLDQLSKKYQRHIAHLDHVPDEELDFLRDAGITGLWLIGLWERSIASQRVKQMMGNADAVASAYSLMDYRIAADLGGDAALENLKARAWQRGIRLASDMVPNHMGIDSHWVINHPDRFLALNYAPYPNYTFNGPDLSNDARVGVYLEDHYYNHSDAAVVFKRLDKWTGEARYIYHGNDGTSMPWNDTAQLDYLNPETREAVIQTIFAIARQFPIIRFDAAMTLAKKHVKRLWFPDPGAGDGIPSRAAFGMTAEQFDALLPNEFWREVVDRAAHEIPDTLLMAEAFWLMEGYFVRTLGMHRVYNSAFMHMLRDEDNAKYRQLIKNTIEFDPEILKRYVNFVTNHDEKTAAEQFGKGEKYFGICALMSTLPGLPMFGHGQFEGFGEKYGVEYRRPRLDERVDEGLLNHHRHAIFPLLHKRYVFSGVENFWLYDLYEGSTVNEDVIAYSNAFGDEHGLVIYHNRFGTARGWLKNSAAVLNKATNQLQQQTLANALGLHNDDQHWVVLRDSFSGLEFLRNCRELHERGLYVELNAYQCQAFIHIREVHDVDGSYARLARHLQGGGVAAVDEAARELRMLPVLTPYRAWFNAENLQRLVSALYAGPIPVDAEADHAAIDLHAPIDTLAEAVAPIDKLGAAFGVAAQTFAAQARAGKFVDDAVDTSPYAITPELQRIKALLAAPKPAAELEPTQKLSPSAARLARAQAYLAQHLPKPDDAATWTALLGWLFNRTNRVKREHVDEWRLGNAMHQAFVGMGLDDWRAWQSVNLVKVLLDAEAEPQETFAWLQGPAARALLQVNAHNGVNYFNKEAFEVLAQGVFFVGVLANAPESQAAAERNLQNAFYRTETLLRAMEKSGYDFDKLLAGL